MLPRFFCAVFLTAGCARLAALCVCAAFLAGCGPDNSLTKPGGKKRQTPQLTVLVIDDPALADTIKSEWRSRTEDEVVIRKITWKEAAAAQRLPGDLVVYPAGEM